MYPHYGVYLIPPPALVYALSLAHQVLAAEFGAQTGSRFMVHCTVKGFTKLVEGASPAAFLPALDELLGRTPAFPTEIYPPWISVSDTGASILLGLSRTEAFNALHLGVWETLAPFVAPDCPFTPVEPAGDRFGPHLTLAQADVPAEPGLLAQAEALSRHIFDHLPTHAFVARDLQLVKFLADDWATWWETLRFRQLRGWRLPEP